MLLVRDLPRVKEIRVDGDEIRGEDLAALTCLASLEMLSLESLGGRSTGIARSGTLTDSDLAPLKRAARLQSLALD